MTDNSKTSQWQKFVDATTEHGTPVNKVLADIRGRLAPKYGDGEARAMARIIFENIRGWSPVDLAIHNADEIGAPTLERIDNVVKRLLADEPIQQIFGNAIFYGMKFRITPDVLIPRSETAELVDIIVKENQRKDLRVLDCGTGSGCIAIALQRNLNFPEVTAIDISDAALAVARENATALKAPVKFQKADILQLPNGVTGAPYDIIVSNPPYIADSEKASMARNVLDFEPATALFVPDSDPLKFYRPILEAAAAGMLSPGGKLYFEINPLFADRLAALARKSGFSDVQIIRDTEGKNRFMSCVSSQAS